MKLTIMTFLLFLSLSIYSQSNEPDGSSIIVLPVYESPSNLAGNISGFTSTLAATCSAVADDDGFIQFTAVTQGAQFILNSASFDGVLELLDNTFTSLTCTNTAIGIGEEVIWYTTLVPGDNYYLRIHSADGITNTGVFDLQYSSLPEKVLAGAFRTTNVNGNSYRLTDYIRRIIGSTVEETRWKFRNTTTNETYVFVIIGDFYQVSLDDAEDEAGTLASPFFCYGNTYEVSIESVVNGLGCGYGQGYDLVFEDEPTTVLSGTYIGAFLNPGADFIAAANTHNDQIMDWEFSEFGSLLETIQTTQGNNRLYLNTSTQLIFNRAYTVRIRVTSCGVTGPWSEYYQFFTTDIPYVSLISGTCNSIINNGSSVNCGALNLATGYFWQLAPILLDDPAFTPIGPAVVLESTVSAVVLSGLDPNTAYRIAVKPVFANGAQVGEYGTFCQIGTSGSGVGMVLEDNSDESTNIQLSNLNDKITLYPNPVTKGTLFIDILDKDTDYSLLIYNSYGELNYKDVLRESSSIDLSSFQKGTYIVKVVSENSIFHERILIR
jgi:hypothetical protein|tara:strand:- start:5896 stop:7542 length:1647 start_codon:yes stop_codon:yes gene_type:complete